MPQEKLVIVPVQLDIDTNVKKTNTPKQTTHSSQPICAIQAANAEIFFYCGVDEHIIQTVMRELKHL